MTASSHAGEAVGDTAGDARPLGSARRARVRLAAVLLASVLLVAAGVLTHFEVGAGHLAAADSQIMHMQRMGPPAGLQPAYEEMHAGTVLIRRPGAARLIAAGIYAGIVTVNPALPGVTSILPRGVRKILGTLKGPAYDAVFVAPDVKGLSGRVSVAVAGKNLPGDVAYQNVTLGLVAVKVPVTQDELGKLAGPPVYFSPPTGRPVFLRRLFLYRGPQASAGSAFVLTSGSLGSAGQSRCGASMSGADPGSPVGWISTTGELVLAGLAVPAAPAGRCALIGSWLIRPFLQLMEEPLGPRTGAFLGAVVRRATATAQLASGRAVRGVAIVSVTPGGPAAQAGLRMGDLVVSIGSTATVTGDALIADIDGMRPRSVHVVTIVRDGRRDAVRVRLGQETARPGS
jgi:hypothetical protein